MIICFISELYNPAFHALSSTVPSPAVFFCILNNVLCFDYSPSKSSLMSPLIHHENQWSLLFRAAEFPKTNALVFINSMLRQCGHNIQNGINWHYLIQSKRRNRQNQTDELWTLTLQCMWVSPFDFINSCGTVMADQLVWATNPDCRVENSDYEQYINYIVSIWQWSNIAFTHAYAELCSSPQLQCLSAQLKTF